MYTNNAASLEQANKLIISDPKPAGLYTPGKFEVGSINKYAGGKSKRNKKGKSKRKSGGEGKKYNTKKLKNKNRFTRSKRINYKNK